MTPEQLAGQVIVGRYHGTDPAEAARLVGELHLAGVCVTAANVTDADQVRATTEAVSAAVAEDGRGFPAVIGVDQEGGSVAHLRGIATDFPAFATAGDVIAADPAGGPALVAQAADAAGLELRGLGFTWVFAPVADVTIGPDDPTIGDRSASTDPQVATRATRAAVRGYRRAGIVPTLKHFPGHGSATADSHEALPEITETEAELAARDLRPFRRAIRAGAPVVMVGHLDVDAVAPGVPSSLAPETYALLRHRLRFRGVTITDSLGMGAVAARPGLPVRALQAGADLLLMPADTEAAHAQVVSAVESGELPRWRLTQAAVRVVALQLWQQRVAAARPVPADAAARAQAAAAALVGAGG
ncbi:MAG: glycoside hydrolase family 3 N-terminal domain-containing protein [Nocardioides sp.]